MSFIVNMYSDAGSFNRAPLTARRRCSSREEAATLAERMKNLTGRRRTYIVVVHPREVRS